MDGRADAQVEMWPVHRRWSRRTHGRSLGGKPLPSRRQLRLGTPLSHSEAPHASHPWPRPRGGLSSSSAAQRCSPHSMPISSIPRHFHTTHCAPISLLLNLLDNVKLGLEPQSCGGRDRPSDDSSFSLNSKSVTLITVSLKSDRYNKGGLV